MGTTNIDCKTYHSLIIYCRPIFQRDLHWVYWAGANSAYQPHFAPMPFKQFQYENHISSRRLWLNVRNEDAIKRIAKKKSNDQMHHNLAHHVFVSLSRKRNYRISLVAMESVEPFQDRRCRCWFLCWFQFDWTWKKKQNPTHKSIVTKQRQNLHGICYRKHISIQ